MGFRQIIAKEFWMKKILLTVGMFLNSIQLAYCEIEEVNQELSQVLKSHSNDPSVLTIIISLLFVLCLIYATGVIYSKLNVYGAKTVKKQMKDYDMTKVIVLSTTQLGQGKNLHVLELEGKRMLIGATPNSINLIKELETTDIKESFEKEKIDSCIEKVKI